MQVYKVIEQILPRDYGAVHMKLYMAYDLIDFCMLYFHFWPSLFTIVVSQIAMFFVTCNVYATEVTQARLAELVAAVIWQCLNVTMAHLVINWTGNTYMNAEISKVGNEGLLNNLKEGVIIVDEESSLVFFVNQAAKRFNIKPNVSLTINLDKEGEDTEHGKVDEFWEDEKLAHIDKSLLRSPNLDSKKMLQ